MAWCHQSASHYLSQCWPCRHALYLFNALTPNEAYDTFNTLRPDMTHNTFNALRPPWGKWHIFSTLNKHTDTPWVIWYTFHALKPHEAYNIYINTLTLHELYNTFNILRPKAAHTTLHEKSCIWWVSICSDNGSALTSNRRLPWVKSVVT